MPVNNELDVFFQRMDPPAATNSEALARAILRFRTLGFFNAHRTVDAMVDMISSKILQLCGGPIDSAAAELLAAHTFLGRVAALNRGFAAAPETGQ